MFCAPDEPRKTFPKLKGRAAEVKHLMPALLWFWKSVRNPADSVHNQVELALQCSVYMDEALDNHRDLDCLPPVIAENFKQAGFALNAAMNYLLVHFASLGEDSEYLFNIVPKNHYLCHLALQAYYINPRLGLCYAGEDMMKQMRRLSAGCVKGNGPRQAANKLMQWYGHALSRLLDDRGEFLL